MIHWGSHTFWRLKGTLNANHSSELILKGDKYTFVSYTLVFCHEKGVFLFDTSNCARI